MNGDKVYRVTPQTYSSLKSGNLRIVNLEGNELITLKGPAVECFKLFDGKSSVREIEAAAKEIAGKSEITEDFQKLLSFLIKFQIIEEVDV